MAFRRGLWLALALVLAVVVPFLAVGILVTQIGWPAAIILSLCGLVAAGFAVRRSAREV